MRTLYNVLFTVAFFLSAPYYFFRMVRRGGWSEGFAERFGKYDSKLKQALTNRHVLWLHAVSVGEVNLVTELIRALEPRLPLYKILVSTTTSTGMAELRRRLPSHITKIYYPIDRRKYVQRAMSLIHPEAVVLVEAEIWPNFLWSLQRRGVPHFLVNARVSDRSYRGYRRFGFLFRQLFAGFTGVGAQSEQDAVRLRELGFRPEGVQVMGSLKFESARVEERRVLDVPRLLQQVGVGPDALVWVAGSTHAGEEQVLVEILQRLKPKHPRLFLVLVPRHHERGREVGDLLKARGVAFAYRTEIRADTRRPAGSVDCLLVNTTGELRFFYQRADVVFVGKSLTAEGGQNPIEPAALGKAVLFGPNMQNFPQVVPQFLAAQAVVQVRDARELETEVDALLADPARREELGRRARTVVESRSGGLERTIAMILPHLDLA